MNAPTRTDAQAAAHRRSAPALDRSAGRVRFDPHAAPGRAAELAEFLTARGVRAVVADERAVHPEVRLMGIPDLDRVRALIGEWVRGDTPEPEARTVGPSREPTHGVGAGDTAAGPSDSLGRRNPCPQLGQCSPP